jgi:serine phosphatase RsbU (regulator of sigma subunit)
MDQLEVIDRQGRRQRIDLDRPRLLIGREPNCDLHLSHPGVSRRHAQLQRTAQGRWLLQDLNSRNHVYVDDRPVQQLVLEPRKPFRIAEYWLILHDRAIDSQGTVDDVSAADVLQKLPDQAAPSVQGASEEAGWLDHLHVFQRAVARLEDPRLVLQRLAREFRRVARPRGLALGVADDKGYAWEVVLTDESADAPLSLDGANRRLSECDRAVVSWRKVGPEEETPSGDPALCLLFPLRGRLARIGHVYVEAPALSPWPPAVQRYLELLAAQAGLVWDNLRLGSAHLAQLALERELLQARQIQIELFPPTFEVDERLDAFAVNLPSAEVSGDYYDLLRTGPDTVAFVIADAMGHGMPAAILMAAVRAVLRMGLTLNLPWLATFQGLDGAIRQARGDTFVTGIVGELDLRRRELALVSAGHPLPSILVNGQPIAFPVCCQTRPWGLEIDACWEVGRIPLGSGPWSVLCYTDGITDGSQRAQRLDGARRVAAFHQAHCQLGAEDLCQGLLTELAHQPGAPTLADDQTVLALRSA